MRPFFLYYGSKFRVAKKYPTPTHPTIVEPFAGSAGYALRNNAKRVVLCDLDENIVSLWKYLIQASPKEILNLPDIPPNGSLDDFDLDPDSKKLIGFWLNTASAAPAKKPSSWMKTKILSKPDTLSFWGERVRESIASQLHLIRHWEVYLASFQDAPVDGAATWFIDPPYQVQGKHYRKSSRAIDFNHLSQWCKSLRGQVIVCEQEGAQWLPFSSAFQAKTAGKKPPSSEVWWISESA